MVLAVLCVAATVMAVSAYLPPDRMRSALPTRNGFHFAIVVSHLFTGGVALSLGWMQFWPWLRTRHPRVHRVVGRIYLFAGVFPGALFGAVAATMAVIGLPSIAPLSLLSVLWFGSALLGVRAALQGRYADHREWMIRNYALTTSAMSGRLIAIPLVMFMMPSGPAAQEIFLHDLRSLLAWGPMTVHIIVAEWIIQRGRSRKRS